MPNRPDRPSSAPLAVALAMSLAVAAPAGAQRLGDEPSQFLVVLDYDAHSISEDNAGALFDVDLSASASTAPAALIAADAAAPEMELVSGIAVSPTTGTAYISDLLIDGAAGGRIYAVDPDTGTLTLLTDHPLLQDPFDLTFMPDGTLVVTDWQADPTGLGDDGFNGGYGGVFTVDTTTGAVSILADGLNHGGTMSGVGAGESAFLDPVGSIYDPVSRLLYVVDYAADPLDRGNTGAVYSVDPADGAIRLVSTHFDFFAPISISVLPDGRPIVADALAGESVIWVIDPDGDPEDNVTVLSDSAGLMESVAVDPSGVPYFVDSGLYDEDLGEYTEAPTIFRVDPVDPNVVPNAVVVNVSSELVYPVDVAAIPVPELTDVSPNLVDPSASVRVEGQWLFANGIYFAGDYVAVSNVVADPANPGTAVTMTLTKTGEPVVPTGCNGETDFTATHRYGGSDTLVDGIRVTGVNMGLVPTPPASVKGDANADGIVDGLDLAVLGRHFGAEYCDGLEFENDADFDDNDILDGNDLAVIATFFGLRP